VDLCSTQLAEYQSDHSKIPAQYCMPTVCISCVPAVSALAWCCHCCHSTVGAVNLVTSKWQYATINRYPIPLRWIVSMIKHVATRTCCLTRKNSVL